MSANGKWNITSGRLSAFHVLYVAFGSAVLFVELLSFCTGLAETYAVSVHRRRIKLSGARNGDWEKVAGVRAAKGIGIPAGLDINLNQNHRVDATPPRKTRRPIGEVEGPSGSSAGLSSGNDPATHSQTSAFALRRHVKGFRR